VAGSTFTRRRVILLLALTTVMLVTMDLRGSGAVNGLRSVFGTVFRPVESVTRVIVRPVENAWNGIVNYGDVLEENQRLKDLVAYGEGAKIGAIASVREAQELLALNGLPTLAGINSCSAQVVGESPSNFAQTVEINRGSECGIKVGMPVLNAAGLIGKVTDVYNGRAVVMLVTDPSYSLAVKVVNTPPTTTTVPGAPGVTIDTTTTTTSTTTTTIPRTTTTGIPGFVPGGTVAPVLTTNPSQTTSPNATVQLPTGTGDINKPGQANQSEITVPAGADLPLRETGALEGRGISKAPVVRFIENQPRFGEVNIGSPVVSAGGASSLAPPDIVIGTVSRVIKRTGSLGPLLEVKISANLDALNFVRVMLYQPSTERVNAP
jgi:rod shape-determining protein MreC